MDNWVARWSVGQTSHSVLKFLLIIMPFLDFSQDIPRLPWQPPSSAWPYVTAHYDTGGMRTLDPVYISLVHAEMLRTVLQRSEADTCPSNRQLHSHIKNLLHKWGVSTVSLHYIWSRWQVCSCTSEVKQHLVQVASVSMHLWGKTTSCPGGKCVHAPLRQNNILSKWQCCPWTCEAITSTILKFGDAV